MGYIRSESYDRKTLRLLHEDSWSNGGWLMSVALFPLSWHDSITDRNATEAETPEDGVGGGGGAIFTET